jgi:hypothetical protein
MESYKYALISHWSGLIPKIRCLLDQLIVVA